jgi:hypothetical protein
MLACVPKLRPPAMLGLGLELESWYAGYAKGILLAVNNKGISIIFPFINVAQAACIRIMLKDARHIRTSFCVLIIIFKLLVMS